MGVQKRKKMSEFLNYKMRVTINDSRIFIGRFMSFDQHKNVILGDCEEFRKIKSNSKSKVEREEKRELGLVVIRGEHVVCMTVEGPPPSEEKNNDLADVQSMLSMAKTGVDNIEKSQDSDTENSGMDEKTLSSHEGICLIEDPVIRDMKLKGRDSISFCALFLGISKLEGYPKS